MDCSPARPARPTNRLDRFRIADGLFGWDTRFPRQTCDVPCQAIGLEIGVLLAGERHCMRPTGLVRFTPEDVSVFEIGDRYTTRYRPVLERPGRELGVVLRLDKHPRFAGRDAVVTFPDRPTLRDVALREVFVELARALDDDRTVDGVAIDDAIARFVERHAVFAAADPLARARLAMHADFDRALYMRHFAEIAGVHEATFTRRFAARYGITPTRYRTRLRLSESALLLATRPDLSVREIARRVGFDDVPYFHRAFAAAFGTTPLGLQRGMNDDERIAARPGSFAIHASST